MALKILLLLSHIITEPRCRPHTILILQQKLKGSLTILFQEYMSMFSQQFAHSFHLDFFLISLIHKLLILLELRFSGASENNNKLTVVGRENVIFLIKGKRAWVLVMGTAFVFSMSGSLLSHSESIVSDHGDEKLVLAKIQKWLVSIDILPSILA